MKDPYTTLSVISAIASLMSIILDVPKKISVSFKTFILILSLLCALFFWFTSNNSDPSKGGEENNQPNTPSNGATVSGESSKDSYTTGTSSSISIPPVNPPQKEKGYVIEPLVDNSYNVSPITLSPLEIPPTEVITIDGEIFEDKQQNDYEFVPTVSGIHRIEFSNVPDGTDFMLKILNSGREQLKYDYDLDNGDGFTYSFEAGELYYLCVQQYENFGTYRLNIGTKKGVVNISNVTSVSDSIQYIGQQNDYSFTANLSGVHRFDFSDVPDGTDLYLTIYNSGWEQLKYDYDLDTGDGFSYLLEEGKLYYIRVQQYENLGAYVLNVGTKKPLIDISDFTAISDSVQYAGQQNDYSFTAKQSGIHRFEFSDVPDGTDLRLIIYNSGWEELKSEYDLDNSDGITYGLEAGKSYNLRVQQYENLGGYTFNIGVKKPVVDISNITIVSDCIQYTNQQNDYMLTANTNGLCKISFSNVQDSVDFSLAVYNSGWEELKSDYDLGNDDSFIFDTASGQKYYIRVLQRHGYSSFTLNFDYNYRND